MPNPLQDSEFWREKDGLLLELRRQGKTFPEIGAQLGASEHAARARFRRLRERPVTARPLHATPEFVNPDGPNPFFDLSPIQLPAITVRAPRFTASDFTVVAGDFHFPEQDDDAVSIFLQAVRDLRPKMVVLNGDLPDMLAVSRYPKDMRHTWSLLEERIAYHRFLRELFAITSEIEGCRVIETDANHSGSGVESRWWRYLSERLGELRALGDVMENLSYTKVWHPQEEWCQIEQLDYVQVTDGLIALHGDVVRSKAAYSARGMLDKWHHSLIHGHTHRTGMTSYRMPPVGGRPERILRAYEGGCMCKLKPSYVSVADWSQGFTIVNGRGEQFAVEQVVIERGVAVIASLGGEYRGE